MVPVFHLTLSILGFLNAWLKSDTLILSTLLLEKFILLISNKHYLSANLLSQEFTILFLLQNGINSDGVLSGDCWREFLQQRGELEAMQTISYRHAVLYLSTPQSYTPPNQTSHFIVCTIVTEVYLTSAQLASTGFPVQDSLPVWSSVTKWLQIIIKLTRHPTPIFLCFKNKGVEVTKPCHLQFSLDSLYSLSFHWVRREKQNQTTTLPQ